jgi:hypothetical protein
MGAFGGPDIITDGLVFAVDAGSTRSYAGSGTTAYNLVANNDVSLINGLGWQSGNGGYFSSDGTDDGMTTPDAANLDLVDFTLEGWVWWDQHKNYGSFLVKGPGGSGGLFNYSFFGYATTVSFGFGNGSGYINTAITAPATGEWHHIVGTYDGTILRFYLNGALEASNGSTQTPNQNNDALQILQSQYSIDGRIGCARVYNQALTASEVIQNYNAQKSRFRL